MSVVGDLVTMAGGDAARVYPFGSVPLKPTYPYRVLGYAPDIPQVRTMNSAGDPKRRFWVMHYARTSDGLEDATDATFATFDHQYIDGDMCEQESSSPPARDPDDRGVLNVTHTYTF